MRHALAGRDAVILDRCPSTNDIATERARTGAPHLSIVVADVQDAGRGRLDRSWIAEPGAALLCSIIVRPTLELPRWGLLPLLAGLAAAEAIEARTGVAPRLKWPNDLVVDDAKLGGILSEADPGTWAVLGIGINVSATPSVDVPVTSLALAGAHRLDRADLAAAILGKLDTVLEAPDDALIRYVQRSATIGAQVRVTRLAGERIVGTAVGIDPDGSLRVDVDDALVHVHAGDVETLRRAD